MQVTANGQVQRSATEWRGIIERYGQSGMGMKECCGQEGVTLGTFEKWYQRIRSGEQRKGQFVEVKPLSAAAGPWAVEGEWPSGVRLRLRG